MNTSDEMLEKQIDEFTKHFGGKCDTHTFHALLRNYISSDKNLSQWLRDVKQDHELLKGTRGMGKVAFEKSIKLIDEITA